MGRPARNVVDFEALLQEAKSTIESSNAYDHWTPKGLLSSVQLRPYQLAGVKWIGNSHATGYHGILADEMGLGKTLQTIAFLSHLHSNNANNVKSLIIIPLSLMMNWKSEWEMYAPGIEVALLQGDSNERQIIKDTLSDTTQILMTTYEMANKEINFLAQKSWNFMVIDEGHRLKNPDSLLYRNLTTLTCQGRLLLTGTPVQNNLLELHALLRFCNPNGPFPDSGLDFASWYKDDDCQLRLSELENEKICDSITSNEECCHSGTAFTYTKGIVSILIDKELVSLPEYAKDWVDEWYFSCTVSHRLVDPIAKVIMQLRKCANHPYLFQGIEPEPFDAGEHLIDASGKLAILDKLLKYLKDGNHRVLIFSQMTHMLDVLQDYLEYRGYSYQRLDGSIRGSDRYEAVETFQNQSTFIFLLSTRAGGVGLNLTAAPADTVIFFDSDFNPTQDEQAAARIHRIGQTKETCSIRLICQNTVDEIIYFRAKRKLALSDTVLDPNSRQEKQANSLVLSDSKEMIDILSYGLTKLDDDGTPFDFSTLFDNKKPEFEANDQHSHGDVVDDIYHYEGHDYKADKIALEQLTTPLDSLIDLGSLSQEQRLQRVELNRLKKLEAKKRRWEKLGYVSKSFQESEHDLEHFSTVPADITHVIGSISESSTISNEKSIICHIVDNSGEWDSRGLFGVISRLDQSIGQYYERAGSKEIKDLTLGSIHIFEISDRQSVALLIAQKKRDSLDMPAYEEALYKLSVYALAHKAFVRFSHCVSVTETQDKLEHWLSSRGIPVSIYFYKRQRETQQFQITNELTDVLKGQTLFAFVNDDELEAQLRRRIVAYGGKYVADLDKTVTHIIHCGDDDSQSSLSNLWDGVTIESVDEFVSRLKTALDENVK